jgi:hypothetical protein
MDLKSKFYTIFKSLNPYNYTELSEHKFSNVLKYYLFIIFFAVLVMSLMFIPQLYSTSSFVSESVSHFENLNVSSNFKLRESFNVLSDPVIRFDSEQKNRTNELVLITPDMISYKRYLVFGSEREVPLTHGVDVASSNRAKMLISLGVFFILPSLFFWSLVFSIIYFAIAILFTFLIVLIITGLLRMNLDFVKIFKSCIYASTILILLQLLLMPFFRTFWWPLVAYWLLILIVLFLWRDESRKNPNGYRESRDEDRDEDYSSKSSSKSSNKLFSSHGSKTREIFGNTDNKANSGFKSNHKIEARDSYDVDENGNLKSSTSFSKKHKHSSDDDDGYVEL